MLQKRIKLKNKEQIKQQEEGRKLQQKIMKSDSSDGKGRSSKLVECLCA